MPASVAASHVEGRQAASFSQRVRRLSSARTCYPTLPLASVQAEAPESVELLCPAWRYALLRDHLRITRQLACQPKPAAARAREKRAAGERRLVENTGLEPVTSWLQTRRSPS